jgi:hypothetical protein
MTVLAFCHEVGQLDLGSVCHTKHLKPRSIAGSGAPFLAAVREENPQK